MLCESVKQAANCYGNSISKFEGFFMEKKNSLLSKWQCVYNNNAYNHIAASYTLLCHSP